MKIENLRYFLIVVREGSLNKAAETLFLSPQNLGGIIKNLEKELGVTLLVRTPKGVSLSKDGAEFLPYAQEMINAYERYLTKRHFSQNVVNFYTTPLMLSELGNMYDISFGERYYLSIHQDNVDKLFAMLENQVEGIYFLPVGEKEQKRLTKLKCCQSVLAVDDHVVWVCHQSNQLVQKTGDLRAEIAAHLQVMVDTQFREHLGERVCLESIAACKRVMREKEGIFCSSLLHFQKNFQEENEWIVLQALPCQRIEYTLFFNFDLIDKLKEDITAKIKARFLT